MDVRTVTGKHIFKNSFIMYSLAGFLLLSTCFLHFWKIGEMPPGIHVDETAGAYSAYCISKTGAEENGIRYPLYFRSFGGYWDPVYVYTISLPVVNLFGLEKWAIRMPSAAFCIFAGIAMYFLSMRLIQNNLISICGAFVFSVLPWVFPLSRTAIGGFMQMLLGIICGCYFLIDAMGRRSKVSAILAGLSWALAMYSHLTGRPMTAVMLVCFVVALNMLIIKRWKIFGIFVLALFLSLIPMFFYILKAPQILTNRFNSIAVWREGQSVFEAVYGMILRYLEYFHPDFLFISGDGDLRHNIGTGELYLFFIPLLAAGIYVMIWNFRRNPYYRFILLALATYPIAAALTFSHFHSTRCMNGAPFWCLAAIIGLKFFYSKRKKLGVILVVISVMCIYEISDYMIRYFGRYQNECRASFSANHVEAIQKALKLLGENETLYISKYTFFPEEMKPQFKPEFYTNILFLTKLDPEIYQKHGIPKDMVCLYEEKFDRPGIFLTLDSLYLMDENNNAVIKRNFEKRQGNLKLIERIPTPSGINFEIYRVY